jgi:hypothetical protein
MPRKLQQFWIYKFTTDRLKKYNYNIQITLDEARQNGELVQIGESQLIRTLRKVKGLTYDPAEVDALWSAKKKLKSQADTLENREKLAQLEEQIDQCLFVPEIISIVVSDLRHYDRINQQGLWINGKLFKRFIVGSGNARRNTVLMLEATYEQSLRAILNNQRDPGVPITPAKFSAYFGLYNSASYAVSTPRFAVVKDCKLERRFRLDWVVEVEDEGDYLEERGDPITQNLFDGMGLVSPDFVQNYWQKELGLDYLPGAFIIRGPWLKGMCAVFDFHRFADTVAGRYAFLDIWGQWVDIREVDCILTESQLKLWNSYASHHDYVAACEHNDLSWSISRYTPKKEKTQVETNYQFLQVLDLDDRDIVGLCAKTVQYFRDVSGGDVDKTKLYLLGHLVEDADYPGDIFSKIQDPVLRAILLNDALVDDPYVQSHLIHSINQKIKESFMGKLLVDGNFSLIVRDCFAFCEHVFGMPVQGLLPRYECFSKFWNARDVHRVVGMRSPLTHFSEPVILWTNQDAEVGGWFKYLDGCTLLNVHGVEMEQMADCDVDGDLIFTTDQKEMLECVRRDYLPITYHRNTAPKVVIDEDRLWESDKQAFFAKIGYLTNLATTMMAMLPLFGEGSEEYRELMKRMKLARFFQGQLIDAGKGIVAKPIPLHWTKYKKITPEMGADEVARTTFNNSLLIAKRPYFMRWLYPDYNARYKRHLEIYDNIAVTNFGVEIKDLLKKTACTPEEQIILDNYWHYNPLIDTPSVMNRICHYMESQVKWLKFDWRSHKNYDARVLMDETAEIDAVKLRQMAALYQEYRHAKRDFRTLPESDGNFAQYLRYLRKKACAISSDVQELATLAVEICYRVYAGGDKDFAWKLFEDGVLRNIALHSDGVIRIPVLDPRGEIDFLGQRFTRVEMQRSSWR